MQSVETARRVPVPALVAFAVFLLLMALIAGAFYAFDGMALVQGLLAEMPFVGTSQGGPDTETAPPAGASSTALELPDGMGQDFALRLWQEQVDSQANIARLVGGEITSVHVRDVSAQGNSAALGIAVTFADGSTTPGTLGLERFGDSWYVASVTALRADDEPDATPSALPSVEAVDVPLLNTLVSEQAANSDVTAHLVEGGIDTVFIDSVERGQGTATLDVTFGGPTGQSKGQLVAITTASGGEPLWFLARFSEAGASR